MKIRKSAKGISSVLTTLLMIAVAIGSALITHAWIITYLGNTETKVQHVIWIPSAHLTEGDGAAGITIYVQNIGKGIVQLTQVFMNGAMVSEDDVSMSINGFIGEGETCIINVINQSLKKDANISIKVICSSGVSAEGRFKV